MSKHRAITIHITENHDETASIRDMVKLFPDMKEFYKERLEKEMIVSLLAVDYEDENKEEYMATRVVHKPTLSAAEIETAVREMICELEPKTAPSLDEYPRQKNAVFMRPFLGETLNKIEKIARSKNIGAYEALGDAISEYIERNK